MRCPLKTAVIIAVALALAVPAFAASAALADTTTSSNWAGYAVHRSGVKYREVTSVWRQPSAKCTAGASSYSATWVGLGGFSVTSGGLEQIGTEVDCGFTGQISLSAWYELVPAPSHPVKLTVRPGDLIRATVNVVGHEVGVRLQDLTSRRSFTRSLHVASVDVSSAEWIVEAPFDCMTATICQALPLANFGSATFGKSTAVATTGHRGSISDRRWKATRINLIQGGRRFASDGAGSSVTGAALTSPLAANGMSFTVSYSLVSRPGGPVLARRTSLTAGYLVHPGR